MFFTGLKVNFRHMLRQREFFIALLIVFLLVLGALGLSLFTFWGNDSIYLHPAWYYWGYNGKGLAKYSFYGSMELSAGVVQLLIIALLPFTAALAFGYAHYDNVKTGALKQILPRMGAAGYFHSLACVVFLGGFLVIFLPLLLEQLILCLTFPWQTPTNVGTSPALDDYLAFLATPQRYAALALNHPYLYNILLCLVPAVTGGMFALCSFTFSLFFHKSRFLVVFLPGMLLWLIPEFMVSYLPNGAKAYAEILSMQSSTDFIKWSLVAGIFLLLNLVLIELKVHGSARFKDALSL